MDSSAVRFLLLFQLVDSSLFFPTSRPVSEVHMSNMIEIWGEETLIAKKERGLGKEAGHQSMCTGLEFFMSFYHFCKQLL